MPKPITITLDAEQAMLLVSTIAEWRQRRDEDPATCRNDPTVNKRWVSKMFALEIEIENKRWEYTEAVKREAET